MLQAALRTVALLAEGLKRLHEHASATLRSQPQRDLASSRCYKSRFVTVALLAEGSEASP